MSIDSEQKLQMALTPIAYYLSSVKHLKYILFNKKINICLICKINK